MVQQDENPKNNDWETDLNQSINDITNWLQDKHKVEMLEKSMHKAKVSVKVRNMELYNAINETYGGDGWPTHLLEYELFLKKFALLVPNESVSKLYPKAWCNTSTCQGYNQKVFDLLCHFYYFIDQEEGSNEETLQSYSDFSKLIAAYNKVVGKFLDQPNSLTEATLCSFKNNPMYNIAELYCGDSDNWKTFNNFFYRQMNDADCVTGITPLRPIVAPADNHTIVSPADCTFKKIYDISQDGSVGESEKVKLKHFFKIGTVKELLGKNASEKYGERFNNGTFVHYFLSPFDYHRFHTPVSGKVLALQRIEASTYLRVKMKEDGQFDAPDSAEDGYEFTQSRGVLIIDAEGDVGLVAVLPIGMCQVSGVIMYDGTAGDDPMKPEEKVPDIRCKDVVKGQEFGKFNFGGSDIIMLFEKPRDQIQFFKESPNRIPIHFQYGQPAAVIKT